MTLSQTIAPHLPFVRRFARALTGSQMAGDSYVAALLESLIADSKAITGAKDMKIELYRQFCRLWTSIIINKRADKAQPSWELSAQEKLAQMQGDNRLVFLLMAVEGFSKGEVAKILHQSEDTIAEHYEAANEQISSMLKTDVMIIEDEPLIALDLQELVLSLGHRVVGVARTRNEAVKLAAEKHPRLILSDIQLADGSSGIDAVNDILGGFDAPVIFITAFPERLLTGTRPEPTFLITKPFLADMVKAVMAQALFFDIKSKLAA